MFVVFRALNSYLEIKMIENIWNIISIFSTAFYLLLLLIISIIPPLFSLYRLIIYGFENLRPENHQDTIRYISIIAIASLGTISFLNGNHLIFTIFAFLMNGMLAGKRMIEQVLEELNIPNCKNDIIIEGDFTVIEENNTRPRKNIGNSNSIGNRS